MPFVFFFLLYIVNRSYAEVLIKYPEGRYLLAAGVFLQVLGFVTIKRIVSVKM